MLRVHLSVNGLDFQKHLKQVHVRPFVPLLLLDFLIDRNHEVFRGKGSSLELKEKMRAAAPTGNAKGAQQDEAKKTSPKNGMSIIARGHSVRVLLRKVHSRRGGLLCFTKSQGAKKRARNHIYSMISSPKWPSGAPLEAARAPKEVPKGLQEGPGASQNDPRETKRYEG